MLRQRFSCTCVLAAPEGVHGRIGRSVGSHQLAYPPGQGEATAPWQNMAMGSLEQAKEVDVGCWKEVELWREELMTMVSL